MSSCIVVAVLLAGGFVAFSSGQSPINPHTDRLGFSSLMVLGPIQASTAGRDGFFHRPAPPALVSECIRVVLDLKQSTISFSGRPAILVYSCSKDGFPAFFTSFSRSPSTQPVIPSFTIPAGWTLGVGVAKLRGDCSSKDPMVTLKSGSALTLRSGTPYVYCMSLASAQNFTSFSISWIQQ